MAEGLRLAHIAVLQPLSELAAACRGRVRDGHDDLGHFSYFDLTATPDDGAEQTIRFASHDNDMMAHILAERIDAVDEIAAALTAANVRTADHLSISTDQDGNPLRSLDELLRALERARKFGETAVG